jgi:RTX calcium-binding nonapeptide repeat (4 copies)
MEGEVMERLSEDGIGVSCRARGTQVAVVGLVAVTAVLVFASVAAAAPTAAREGAAVSVEAPPGEANVIHPKIGGCLGCGAGSPSYYAVQDTGQRQLLAGSGCSENAGNDGVLCGEVSGVSVLRLALSDGNDRALRPDPFIFDGPPVDHAAVRADYDGGPGTDNLRGGDQDDNLNGSDGNDYLAGYAGGDLVVGGPGADVLSAGEGDDLLQAADLTRDVVSCGEGYDVAVVDKKDAVRKDCERVRIRRA